MKFIERAVLVLFGLIMLFAFHQTVARLMQSHGWKGLGPSDWAAWVQAIGSIAAILGAYFIGERQSKASLRTVSEADRLAAYRRGKSILAVTDAAQSHTSSAMNAFNENGFDYFILKLGYDDETMKNLIGALAAIPVHELGSYESVAAILRIRNSMMYFQKHIKRCIAQVEASRDSMTGGVNMSQLFDTTAIHICMKEIVTCNKIITEEVAQMKPT